MLDSSCYHGSIGGLRRRKRSAPRCRPETRDLTQFWYSCAGAFVMVPRVRELIFYFPQGHREEITGRSYPNDKLLLVQALKRRGYVVAVTGDGTNDAPSLHEADIGLARGISRTEVAEESSDIVIMDDNFASVVKLLWVNLIIDSWSTYLGNRAINRSPYDEKSSWPEAKKQ